MEITTVASELIPFPTAPGHDTLVAVVMIVLGMAGPTPPSILILTVWPSSSVTMWRSLGFENVLIASAGASP